MGLDIKRKANGRFVLKSTVSDSNLHDESDIDLDEAKRILINKALWKFIDSVIEIDMEFPNGYMVNGRICQEAPRSFLPWKIEALKSDDPEIFDNKFKEICAGLNINFDELIINK